MDFIAHEMLLTTGISRLYGMLNVMLLLSPSPSALVWGSSVKHNPRSVGKDHVLQDEDVVQIVKK